MPEHIKNTKIKADLIFKNEQQSLSLCVNMFD